MGFFGGTGVLRRGIAERIAEQNCERAAARCIGSSKDQLLAARNVVEGPVGWMDS